MFVLNAGMKLLFIDLSPRAYDCLTGLSEPLGGTQSAVAGLSKALALRGHDVTVVNGVAEPREVENVKFISQSEKVQPNDYDILIPVSVPLGRKLKSVGCTKPIVLWAHHDSNQPACFNLATPEEKSIYSGFVFVSEWQKSRYELSFRIFDKTRIIRNAISEPFLNVERRLHDNITLAYTSTPYRGLDVLLLAFSTIRKHIPECRLKIFSSMAIYGETDPYEGLYETARKLDGVEYVGALSQVRLADELAGIDYWTYPSTFPETSCISAMEAMAAGCGIISTELGALPETCAGFGALMDLQPDITPIVAGRFAAHVVNSISNLSWFDREGQVAYARACNWDARAKEWEDYLGSLI